jgi:hypothetical protein
MGGAAFIVTKSGNVFDRILKLGYSKLDRGRMSLECQPMVAEMAVIFSNVQGADMPTQHLHKVENDLIARHYHLNGCSPAMQFRSAKVTRDQR